MGYRFGDGTRLFYRAATGLVAHLRAHPEAIRDRWDCVKFGRALVDYVCLHGTLSLGVVATAAAGAVRDPASAQDWAALVAGVGGILNLARRLRGGRPEA